jgi:hypothetical protein
MLSALSKHVVPVNSTYDSVNMLGDLFNNGHLMKLNSNCILRCMTDNDKPAIPGQNQSFLKLCIQRPLDGLTGYDPIFVVMLVDFIDGKIPEDYRPRLYHPGFDKLLTHLYSINSFNHFFNVVLQAVTLWSDTFSISTVEDLSAGALQITLPTNNKRAII